MLLFTTLHHSSIVFSGALYRPSLKRFAPVNSSNSNTSSRETWQGSLLQTTLIFYGFSVSIAARKQLRIHSQQSSLRYEPLILSHYKSTVCQMAPIMWMFLALLVGDFTERRINFLFSPCFLRGNKFIFASSMKIIFLPFPWKASNLLT